MYKLVILMCAVAAAHAGYLGGYAAPAVTVAHAPVAVAPAASSYANTYRVSQTARLLAAPAVAAAPVAYAAPAIHAPVAYAAPAVAAPILKYH
ncbi:cuticle protein 38-like [Schistocerca cancellata]|uniref:cuticle protein 38-like n=1 Tax=Schistocerca cancellata TaxID=274614 RepID=UPI002117D5C5|nr:cuticle protein 38-like [Schistocerca cancellata]